MKFASTALLLSLVALPVSAEGPAPTASNAEVDGIRAADARFEAGVFAGVRGWKKAYRKTATIFTYGAFGAWMPISWLGLLTSIEHARRTSSDVLRITNTETLVSVGPRFSIWVGFLRFFLDVAPVGVIRTSNYRDVSDVSNARFSVGLNVGPGFTVAAAERLGVSLRLNWRRRDDQSHMIGTLDVSWLFQ